MAKSYVHKAIKVSWWSGKVTMACGVVMNKATSDQVTVYWGSKCPACKRAGW
jgi:hypothetical protein